MSANPRTTVITLLNHLRVLAAYKDSGPGKINVFMEEAGNKLLDYSIIAEAWFAI